MPYLPEVGGKAEVNELQLCIGRVRLEHPVLQLQHASRKFRLHVSALLM